MVWMVDKQADITGAFKGFTNICNIGFGGEFHGRLGELQTCRPHAQLGKGFLAGNINRAQLFARHACRGLQQQCGFANAGVAAQQCGRTRHQPAAQYAVEFAYAGNQPRRFGVSTGQ
ncbi:MAG: hypothetical protein CM15mP21_3910 [Hyphomicrobiales bacterium]|nr:MAG: hypothetical protein CM15mP21_3910 [Hyphomicrobiales bacterium]